VTLPLAISIWTIVVIFVVLDLVLWIGYVAWRVQRQRDAAGGEDPHQPPPQPAPERRE
jgi:hypothetical protein